MNEFKFAEAVLFEALLNPVTLIAAFGPSAYNMTRSVMASRMVTIRRNNPCAVPTHEEMEGPSWSHALQNYAIQFYTVMASFISFAYAFVLWFFTANEMRSDNALNISGELADMIIALGIVGWLVILAGMTFLVSGQFANYKIIRQYYESPSWEIPYIGYFPPLNRLTFARLGIGVIGFSFLILVHYIDETVARISL